jgi:hypothetical protein
MQLKKKEREEFKRGKAETFTMVDEEWDEYKHFKEKEFERLDKIILAQQEAAKANNDTTRAQEEASRIN